MEELGKEYENYMNQLYNLTKEQIDALDESFCHWKHKALINYIYELQQEKQQLISFLEDKIYRQKVLLKDWKMNSYNYNYQKGIEFAYQEVLDFAKKGGKNE